MISSVCGATAYCLYWVAKVSLKNHLFNADFIQLSMFLRGGTAAGNGNLCSSSRGSSHGARNNIHLQSTPEADGSSGAMLGSTGTSLHNSAKSSRMFISTVRRWPLRQARPVVCVRMCVCACVHVCGPVRSGPKQYTMVQRGMLQQDTARYCSVPYT